MITVDSIQRWLDGLNNEQIDRDFAAHLPETLTRYLLIADALRQLCLNSFPDMPARPDAWVAALLRHMEPEGEEFSLAVALVPEGYPAVAGIQPGEVRRIPHRTIVAALNIAMRVPLVFVKNPAGKVTGWTFDASNYFNDIQGLADWMTVVNYIRGEEIPVMTDDDFVECQ